MFKLNYDQINQVNGGNYMTCKLEPPRLKPKTIMEIHSDMVRNFEGGSSLIEQWLKNKETVLFLGVWEQINNPDFNSPEFEGIKI